MYRPMFGSLGKAVAKTSAIFTSKKWQVRNFSFKSWYKQKVIAVKTLEILVKKI